MVTRGVIAVAVSIVVAGGCELFVSVPQGEVGSTAHCTAAVPCLAAPPYCDLPTNACVECRTGADCTSGAPSCIAGACTGCRIDADCGGTTCLPDGMCADASRIAFASPSGTGDCSQASPCDLDTAVAHLSPTVDIIQLLPGTYTRATALAITTTATIAGSSATLQGTTTTILDVEAGNLTLLDVAIAANSQIGILCQTNGKLDLRRVRVTGASTAVDAQGCELAMDRTSITGGSSYAVVVTTGPVSISSSYVTGNGGGIALSSVATGSIIDSTIASNNLIMGTFGVLCTTSPTVVIENDIIWTNPTDPNCVASYCDLDAGYTGTGTNDVTMDPSFVGAPVDYHLSPTSPLRGLGDPAIMDASDYDGEDRPQPAGSPPDLGADEIP